MAHVASSESKSGNRSSLLGLIKLAGRLAPRQLSDEIALAKIELKRKGIQAGIATGLLVAAGVFAAFLAVALIVAAILGLSTVMPGWLAALIVAAVFLIIAAIAGLIGVSRFKKTLPLLPQQAIRGLQYDLGVVKEGSSFDPRSIEAKKQQAKREKEAQQRAAERITAKQPPAPGPGELKNRSAQRRDKLAALRDALGRKLDLRAHAEAFRERVTGAIARQTNKSPDETLATLKARWQPLTILAVSIAALIVLARRFAKSG